MNNREKNLIILNYYGVKDKFIKAFLTLNHEVTEKDLDDFLDTVTDEYLFKAAFPWDDILFWGNLSNKHELSPPRLLKNNKLNKKLYPNFPVFKNKIIVWEKK